MQTDLLTDPKDREFVEAVRELVNLPPGVTQKLVKTPPEVAWTNRADALLRILDKLAPKPVTLKPCPFCGAAAAGPDSDGDVECPNEDCQMVWMPFAAWQKRA